MTTPNNSEALPPTAGSASEAEQQAPPTSLHEIIVTGMVNRLRRLADDMEETGEALQLLENYVDVPGSFQRGGEMKGAADMARNWAVGIRNATDHPIAEPSDHIEQSLGMVRQNDPLARFAAEVDAIVTPILKISGALDESDVEMHSHLVVKLRALLNSRQNREL